MEVTDSNNTLAYYAMELITAVKSFMLPVPGNNISILFHPFPIWCQCHKTFFPCHHITITFPGKHYKPSLIFVSKVKPTEVDVQWPALSRSPKR